MRVTPLYAWAVERLRGSPVPILAALPLHRNAGWIADLDPDRAWPGSIGAIGASCSVKDLALASSYSRYASPIWRAISGGVVVSFISFPFCNAGGRPARLVRMGALTRGVIGF
jgi:hypothetical protein